eukprot:TRINITY_DN53101_c0_g1_i1.p1 TRINITY_DN53101_c0_g1~~TRINITY_DN53101_c0_g1_i1.p1  ORF type:complete len:163 (+),score=33.88 TRINITY_DN53101_c0_g1_i1:57-545(+)
MCIRDRPVLVLSEQLTNAVSNDPAVRGWFQKLVWVLAVQSQVRVSALTLTSLMVPVGKGTLNVVSTFVCTYLIAVPVAGSLVLTDWATTSVSAKMMMCMGASCFGSLFVAGFGLVYSLMMDWEAVSCLVASRANSDQAAALEYHRCHEEELGGDSPSFKQDP